MKNHQSHPTGSQALSLPESKHYRFSWSQQQKT